MRQVQIWVPDTRLAWVSFASDAPMVRVPVRASSTNGLERPSDVMIDTLTVVHRRRIGRRIGAIEHETMLKIERALAFVLAME
jgi:mRNA interferase MazF